MPASSVCSRWKGKDEERKQKEPIAVLTAAGSCDPFHSFFSFLFFFSSNAAYSFKHTHTYRHTHTHKVLRVFHKLQVVTGRLDSSSIFTWLLRLQN